MAREWGLNLPGAKQQSSNFLNNKLTGGAMTAPRLRVLTALLLGALVLAGAARLRGAEFDEQYTVFLLAGDARPLWPTGVFTAAEVRDRFHGTASWSQIATDLRHGDVHPPLYFWAVSAWSRIAGDTLLNLRLFSVLCALGSLATVGLIACRVGVPAATAMLLTLGCYAFAYTSSIARGFALAQLLALLGVLAAVHIHCRARPSPTMVACGLLLGAASFANYLAAFTAIPVLIWLALRRFRDGVIAATGFAVFTIADLTFFVAQRDSRPGQFPPFHLADGLSRLGKYAAASMAGGLPLYVPYPAPVAAAIAIGLIALTLLVVLRWRTIATPGTRALLAGALIATPAGLLLLGLIFNNTPIELRYLSFSVPYAALLLAGALTAQSRAAVLAVQAAAIAGLLLRPETMQPMRAAAAEAARLADTQTVLLLPRGSDGVGLVGAFVTEAPDDLRILLADNRTDPTALHGLAQRLALARLDRDADSRAEIAALQTAFAADPCWRALPDGHAITVFAETCPPGARQASAVSTAR
jgi:hypothetical protein